MNDASSSTVTKQGGWTLPSTIIPRQVLPDLYTKPEQLQGQRGDQTSGRESDPSRMAIYVCLLDNRPHLHPSLLALNKHRQVVHAIPLPPDPANDPPSPPHPQDSQTYPATIAIKDDSDISIGTDKNILSPKTLSTLQLRSTALDPEGVERTGEKKEEWFMWKFTEEEEARRKAYLPLA